MITSFVIEGMGKDCVIVFFIHFITLLIPWGKCRPPYLGMATVYSSRKSSANQSYSACWVFTCFCNPPNSDMDYRIFNVRTWSFLCVRIHMRVGHTDRKSARCFWLGGGLSKFFMCSWRDLKLGHRSPTPYQLSHPATPEAVDILLQTHEWRFVKTEICIFQLQTFRIVMGLFFVTWLEI